MTTLIKDLRKELHEMPEVSMQEFCTKERLIRFIRDHAGTLKVVDRGAWFYAMKRGRQAGPAIAFRADFDAVLCADGVCRHVCGHDGHSAVLAGFAVWLDTVTPERDVYLIFQPGEETGQGAAVCCELLDEVDIGEIYGFHNIPGYEKGKVILLEDTFACASTGLEIRLTGEQSHAAYPENGNNPALVLAEVIRSMHEVMNRPHEGIVLGTVIGIEAGSRSYGVSAGEGVLRLTLRAQLQDEFDDFVAEIEKKAQTLASDGGLICRTARIEEFPATINHRECVEKVRAAAGRCGREVILREEPFRWSEDFGYYLQRTKGAFFGIGCGEEHADLHTLEYDFEDEIAEDVLALYQELIR